MTTQATPHAGEGQIDPVLLGIINNNFVNICREMGITMTRTAFSPIFNEGLDFSCVLFDKHLNMIGQAEFCPAQLAASLFIVRWTVEELGVDSFEPGDVVLHNDPYRGGAHIPEHSVIRPVFYEGELWGFVANVGHLAEIGGKAVGSFAADATEVFQEGLRIPPIKIVSRDENNMDLWRLIMANHRTPRNTWGDLNAQIGSLRVAERSLHRAARPLRRGVRPAGRLRADGLLRALDAGRRSPKIPNGSYEFTDWMEDDGVVDEPVKFHVTVTIEDDRMIVDWTGSSPQVRGPINATYGVTSGAVYNAVFHVTDSSIPKNSGAYRPIHIIAPPGSVTNVVYPGPSVGGNTETHPKLVDMVTGALAPVMREKVAAAEGASACNFLFGGFHPKTGDYYANYHLEGCGWGAKDYDDGNDCTIVVNGNCRNTPVEIFETRYPLETVEYSLLAGLRRGGPQPRRPRHAADHAHRAGRRGDGQRAVRPHEGRVPGLGPGGRRPGRLRRDPRQAQRRDRRSAPSRRCSARSRRRSSPTSCSRRATRSCSTRPAAAASARRRSATARRSRTTSPRASSAARPPSELYGWEGS